jgi:AraC-like DNA-binding protein
MFRPAKSDCSPAGMLPPEGRGRGLRQGVAVRQGFSLVRTDVTYDRRTETRFECPGTFLRFHFKLTGESAISDDAGVFVPVEAGRISLAVQPADAYKRERVSIDTRERSVTLICDPDFTAGMISPTAELPACIRDFLRNSVSRLCFESFPMPLRLRPIVEDILNPPLTGALGDLMIEAKALELLCFAVHQILHVPGAGHAIRERDRQRVKDLCFILEGDPAATLSIDRLCRELAWNESQMMECFKAVTGTTISNYRHQLRMNRAKRQLEDTDLPVTQIAFDVGYEHPSNFATAFKRTFGISPRSLRRQ